VELDRQSIEKRDFPIGRRGYDPAAVDAHLRSIATDVEALRYALESRAGETLGSSAGTQVQGILEAAEATAADIEQKAADDARETRAQADADAAATRADAVARAQAHVAAVARATSTLSERVESMDAQSTALVASLRDGAARLATDLSAVETNMADLYDAASGRADAPSQAESGQDSPAPPATPPPPAVTSPLPAAPPAAPTPPPLPFPQSSASTPQSPKPTSGAGEDLDGARLIALNMALNGEPRVDTDRYLAEHYELSDRHKLLDEVYAAIEG
jgi:DivIVA domain-containing protein